MGESIGKRAGLRVASPSEAIGKSRSFCCLSCSAGRHDRTAQLPLFTIYWTGCAVLLAWSLYTYAFSSAQKAAYELIGAGLLVSRPAAALLLWSMALMLLLMAKDALRVIFGTYFIELVPLDRHKKFHKQLGWIVAVVSVPTDCR